MVLLSIFIVFAITLYGPPNTTNSLDRVVRKLKEEGDLGFRDMKAWNLALLTKVLWCIHEKQDRYLVDQMDLLCDFRDVDLWE